MKLAVLKEGKEKKVKNHYQWIFKDDVKTISGDPQVGDVISILDYQNFFIGKAFYNPAAKIPLRVISLKDAPIEEIITSKIVYAVKKRKSLKFGRLVFAEADFLPGLIVDRYGDYTVIQIRNPGLFKYKDIILDAIQRELPLKGILIRNDFETLRDASLFRENEILFGEVPKDIITIEENDLKFYVDLWKGQKTGYFYDQRDNRKMVSNIVNKGMKGLDLYTYTGAFAIHAAKQGAYINAVDKSKNDLLLAEKNAKLNGTESQIKWINDDVLNYLSAEEEKYDFIICDPPGLAKKKSEVKKIQGHLVDISREMLRILNPGGWLVLFSCSHIMSAKFLTDTLRIAASLDQRPIYLKDTTHQPFDHPVLLQMPETAYLTGVWIIGG